MACDHEERLFEYADGELAPEPTAELDQHLLGCAHCRRELHEIRRRKEQIASALAALDPAEIRAEAAYRRFRESQEKATSWPERLRRRFSMTTPANLTGRTRGFAFGAVAAVALAVLLFLPATRGVLADLLSIFRVRQFSAVSVDHDQMEKLKTLAENLKGVISEPVMERQPGEPRAVTSASEASSVAGFRVQVPSELPAGANQVDFSVVSGPAVRIEFDRERIEAQLDAAGLNGIELPPMESGTIRVDVPFVVHLAYRVVPAGAADTTSIDIVQAQSPTVTLPPGADPQQFGRTFLQLAGVPAADAERLSREIDWTSTLVLPVPRDLGNFQEVDVRGVKGLLLIPGQGVQSGQAPKALLWQRDDVIYSIRANRTTSSEMLRLAESMR